MGGVCGFKLGMDEYPKAVLNFASSLFAVVHMYPLMFRETPPWRDELMKG